ncbi:Reverse transcriptase domain-containing protein, partial [Aphis craccivora]
MAEALMDEIKDMEFEFVENFKYLGVKLSVSGNNHKEIQNRINSADKYFFGLKTILKSKLVSIKSKLTLYKATTKTDEQKLARFERKVLRQIFGPRRNQNTEEYERRENKEVISMLEDSNIVATMKSKRISWAGHVWRGREQTIGQVTHWKPKSKTLLGRPRQRWLDRVNKDLEMLGTLNGEGIATNRDRWREVVVAAKDMN